MEKWKIRGRPTGRAFLEAGIQAGFNKKDLEKRITKNRRTTFQPLSKYLVTLHQLSAQEYLLFVAGAPERILALSLKVEKDGYQEEFTQKIEAEQD